MRKIERFTLGVGVFAAALGQPSPVYSREPISPQQMQESKICLSTENMAWYIAQILQSNDKVKLTPQQIQLFQSRIQILIQRESGGQLGRVNEISGAKGLMQTLPQLAILYLASQGTHTDLPFTTPSVAWDGYQRIPSEKYLRKIGVYEDEQFWLRVGIHYYLDAYSTIANIASSYDKSLLEADQNTLAVIYYTVGDVRFVSDLIANHHNLDRIQTPSKWPQLKKDALTHALYEVRLMKEIRPLRNSNQVGNFSFE